MQHLLCYPGDDLLSARMLCVDLLSKFSEDSGLNEFRVHAEKDESQFGTSIHPKTRKLAEAGSLSCFLYRATGFKMFQIDTSRRQDKLKEGDV